jgi:hypothetical protein
VKRAACCYFSTGHYRLPWYFKMSRAKRMRLGKNTSCIRYESFVRTGCEQGTRKERILHSQYWIFYENTLKLLCLFLPRRMFFA